RRCARARAAVGRGDRRRPGAAAGRDPQRWTAPGLSPLDRAVGSLARETRRGLLRGRASPRGRNGCGRWPAQGGVAGMLSVQAARKWSLTERGCATFEIIEVEITWQHNIAVQPERHSTPNDAGQLECRTRRARELP